MNEPAARSPHVLVLGDANADLVAPIGRFPHEGDDLTIQQLLWASGGSATNVATGLALLGTATCLIARVGTDPAAAIALAAAEAAGVDFSFVQRDQHTATGTCIAMISPSSERTFISFRGANVALVAAPNQAFVNADWLHIGGHALLDGSQRSSAFAAIEAARTRGIGISLDLCLPLIERHVDDVRALLPDLRLMFGNAREIAELGDYLLPAGLTMVIKRGALGCELRTTSTKMQAAAFPAAAIDTNGCGDAFVAAFLSAWLQAQPAQECARIANAAGAYTAERIGAATALPNAAELAAWMQHNAPNESRLWVAAETPNG